MATYRRSTILFTTPLVRVLDVGCQAPRSGCDEEEWCGDAEVVIPRRGVFCLHRRRNAGIADANTVLVFGRNRSYRVSHPSDGGDRCTVLIFRPDVLEEALGSAEDRRGISSPTAQLATHMTTVALRDRAADRLEAEEALVGLLNSLADAHDRDSRSRCSRLS